MKILNYFSIFAILIFSTSLISAQNSGIIKGMVSESSSGEPLIGVNIFIQGSNTGTASDLDGNYTLAFQPGTYTLIASYVGYKTEKKSFTLKAEETVILDFQLEATPLDLGEELIVLGSRTVRSVTETPVPVDIITAKDIEDAGHTELNQVLRTLAPSFNASQQTISDGTDHIMPASLRGLGPDQVLVLLNGKRRHSSALVNVNGTFGRGTVGVDLNAIPLSAIERIEVLRDGAAAQYGSDAIAGVINIVLKKQTNSLQISGNAGLSGEGDGQKVQTGVNYGFKIGEKGYFNISGDFTNKERTNRSGTWTGDIFPGISGTAATDAELANRGLTRDDFSMKTGQGEGTFGMIFFNASIPLAGNAEFYTFGGVSHRSGMATGFFRLPNSEARVVPSLYPNGFLPEIHTQIGDQSVAAGIRGSFNGWDVDLSVTHGNNSFQYNIENTNNASMGASSPISFDAGNLKFGQTTGNLDITRLIDTDGAVKSLTFALGSEFRVENYQIVAGEDASWQLGDGEGNFDTTSTGAPKAAGSQVFPGFQPQNEVNRTRNSVAFYAGLETVFTDQFLVDLGARFENYNDFGSVVIGKVATRYEISKTIALRGAFSTGFRAPSLHQVWFNNVSTQFVFDDTGALVPKQVMTAHNNSAIAKAFGMPKLKAESSVNISAGFMLKPFSGFSFSTDFYYITIKDRIVLTSRFSDKDPIVAGILAPFAADGVSQAQFFTNAVDTKTMGVDVALSYSMLLGNGSLSITAVGNYTTTEVENVNVPQSVADKFSGGDLAAVETTIFNREERNRLEDALPQQKGSLTLTYGEKQFGLTARANYYGSIEYKPTNPANDQTFSAKILFDLEGSYSLFEGFQLVLGANNILNTFPDEHQPNNRSNERFIYSRRVTQYGMYGGYYYGGFRMNL